MTEILLATVLLTALILMLSFGVIGARRILAPSHLVQVTVNDTTMLQGATGQKLLEILKVGDIPIPSACAGVGTCGLCRVRISTGSAGEPLPIELARLNRAEIHDGMRLACQVVVRGALSVQVPDAYLTAESLSCKVSSTRMLAPLITEIILKLPEDAAFTPRPGAFAQVTAPAFSLDFSEVIVDPAYEPIWQRLGWRGLWINSDAPVTRAYSLANTPADAGNVVLTIRLAVPPPGADKAVPPGVVSSYLFSVKPGDSVDISGPYGDFGARNTRREMVFIGGGVGMAPLRSIIHDQLERLGTDRQISYWYGARSQADAFYIEEFQTLTRQHKNFRFALALSDPDPDRANGAYTGFIHDVALREYLNDHPAPEECEFYLCGPPLMINAVHAMLDSIGVEDEMVFFDDFGG